MSFAPYLFTNSQDTQEMMVNPNIKNAIEELKWGLLEWLTISIYDHQKKKKKKKSRYDKIIIGWFLRFMNQK